MYWTAKFQHTAARRRLGGNYCRRYVADRSFNTQPPEGGWAYRLRFLRSDLSFQHTAARRRLVNQLTQETIELMFQHTAARRRLAAAQKAAAKIFDVSTHSRPKAAGIKLNVNGIYLFVSTHSRPKAAGPFNQYSRSQAWFQHTAARRRLGL